MYPIDDTFSKRNSINVIDKEVLGCDLKYGQFVCDKGLFIEEGFSIA